MCARYAYDAFISHAVEDKIQLATELDAKLREKGLSIWYSTRELTVGSNITDTIKDGLAKSRFGIVILSKHYLAKSWPMREFYLLLTRKVNGQKVILPILLDITLKELAAHDPDMADIYAIPASKGIDHVVATLVHEISTRKKEVKEKNRKNTLRIVSGVILALFVLTGLWAWLRKTPTLPRSVVEQSIQAHIKSTQQTIDTDLQLALQATSGKAVPLQEITSLYMIFKNADSRYRNTYSFSNGQQEINTRKHVSAALEQDVGEMNPMNSFLLYHPSIYLLEDTQLNGQRHVRYVFTNTQPVAYTIIFDEDQTEQDFYTVTVNYTNNIRHLESTLTFPNSSSGMKYHSLALIGFRPQETYRFEKVSGGWKYVVLNEE